VRRTLILVLTVLISVAACSLAVTPTVAPLDTPTTTATAIAPKATRTATTLPLPRATATAPASPTPIPPVRVIQLPAGTLIHPLAAAVVGSTVYAIDSGRLIAIDLGSASNVRFVSPPGGAVEGHPVQELASLAYTPSTGTLLLLDRSGNVYGWDMSTQWWIARRMGEDTDPNLEYLVDLAGNGQSAYLLDASDGRVWKNSGSGWVSLQHDAQLDGAIRMAVTSDLYILVGERGQRAARLLRLRAGALSEVLVDGGMDQPTLIAGAPDGSLMLVDKGFRRLRLVDPAGGKTRDVLAGAGEIMALATSADGMVLLGQDWVATVRGGLPEQVGVRMPALQALPDYPHSLSTLASLPKMRMPLAGAHMPSFERLLPDASRPYRFGVHEGIDMYTDYVGVAVVRGTKVLAAADGVVTRADVDYKESSAAQVNEWLSETQDKHMTPPAIQDHLGGRQVWIDHGNGAATRYLHLNSIAQTVKVGAAVKAGDVIGAVGNSGTPEAAGGQNADWHLHFEIRLGTGWLGQWIHPIETRRALARMFNGQ
jgi:hypothetical protein